MTELLHREEFACPYCWQRVSVLLDLSNGSQGYVEDCEVCCEPIQIRFVCELGEIVSFSAERL